MINMITVKAKKKLTRSAALLLILFAGSLLQTGAQPAMRNRARGFLNRTSVVLVSAKTELNKGKNYTGDFSRAVAHQRYAVRLFRNGFYQKAINHSHRARMLALAVIRSNKGQVQRDWELNKEEKDLHANTPSDQQLDSDLTKDSPSLAFDDRKAASADLQGTDVK